jgi:long-chain acyl-CoA synthetase
MLDLSRPAIGASTMSQTSPLASLFADLEHRFVPGVVTKPTSFYFSLGEDNQGKWTLELSAESCVFRQGRPADGKADCVLKTSPELFTKIVRESYTPSVSEFMTGKIKSNDIKLLQVFQKAFGL